MFFQLQKAIELKVELMWFVLLFINLFNKFLPYHRQMTLNILYNVCKHKLKYQQIKISYKSNTIKYSQTPSEVNKREQLKGTYQE